MPAPSLSPFFGQLAELQPISQYSMKTADEVLGMSREQDAHHAIVELMFASLSRGRACSSGE